MSNHTTSNASKSCTTTCTSKYTIITHTGPRHIDDYLAISLFNILHRENKISLIEKPYNYIVDDDSYLDNSIYLFDVGKEYDPLYNLYDHHHDPSLPSTITLYGEQCYDHIENMDAFLESPAIAFIDSVDTIGRYKAYRKHNFIPNSVVKKMEYILLNYINPYYIPMLDSFEKILTLNNKDKLYNLSYNNLIWFLWNGLPDRVKYKTLSYAEKDMTKKGLLLLIDDDINKDKEGTYKEYIDNTLIEENNDKYRIGILNDTPYNFFEILKEFELDIFIVKNKYMSNKSSIFFNIKRNKYCKEYIENVLDKKGYSYEYVDKVGYLIVVDNHTPNEVYDVFFEKDDVKYNNNK